MPLKIFAFVILTLTTGFCTAQRADSGYTIIYNYKVTRPNITIDGQKYFVLDNGKQSISWLDVSSAIQSGEAKGNRLIVNDKSKKAIPVYKNLEMKTVVFEMSTPFTPKNITIFSDSLHPIEWQITNEERVIDSLNCIAATCLFRGRNYKAWFAPEIPLNQGPWKFGGLPGLIVLLTDSESLYEWRLTSLTRAAVEIPPAPVPQDTYQAFARLFREGADKAIEAAKARMGIDPNCIDCGKNASVKVETLERF